MKFIYCLPEISYPGGIGRITSIKANYLVQNKHDVYIITTDQDNKPSYYDLDERVKLINLNINFQNQGNGLIKKIVQKVSKMHRYKKELLKYVYKIKPDVIISTFTNEAGFLYKFKDGSKKVLECHFNHDIYLCKTKAFKTPFYLRLYYLYKTKVNDKLVNYYDAFVVLTEEDKILWGKKKNIHVIPNMLSHLPSFQSQLINKQVIAIGRLDAQKKFDRLIQIWYRVCKENKEWHLNIYGQGSDEEMLNKLIEKLNLQEFVTINKPVKDVLAKCVNSSILAMTSTYEGWGLVLTEAMSCGVPCIAYACKCGPKDIISDGVDGFCIEEENEYEYISKLLLLMEDTELRKKMGEKARQKSLNFSSDILMEKWIALFQNLLQNP